MNPPATPAFSPDFGVSDAALDAALLARVARGDQDAFAALYDRLSGLLNATSRRILGDTAEADDVVHDSFVSIWEEAAAFDPSRGSVVAWALTLARHRALDRLRSRIRRGELPATSIPSDLRCHEAAASEVPLAADLAERADLVRSALGDLPPEQHRALELAFFSGLSHDQIAARLASPPDTIKARIRRGLLALRDRVSPRL